MTRKIKISSLVLAASLTCAFTLPGYAHLLMVDYVNNKDSRLGSVAMECREGSNARVWPDNILPGERTRAKFLNSKGAEFSPDCKVSFGNEAGDDGIAIEAIKGNNLIIEGRDANYNSAIAITEGKHLTAKVTELYHYEAYPDDSCINELDCQDVSRIVVEVSSK